MKRFLLLLSILATAGVIPLSAQNAAFNGICFSGGRSAVVQGLSSTNKLDGVIPRCQVDVYLTGTTTHATIYSNALGTPLANPFRADTLSAAAPGKWLFFAATGQGYDVTMSGGDPPNVYLLPVTLTDLQVGGGGGGTGVTNFSAGNLPPLFITSVTNPSTTPALGFTQSNAAGNTIFGNFNGTSGPPFFAVFTCTGLLTCVYNSGSNTWNVSVPTTSSLSITSTDPIKVNDNNGPYASGTVNVSCPDCGAAQFDMVVNPPIAGNYVIVYPTGGTITSDPPGLSNIFGNGVSAAGGSFDWQCTGLLCSIAGSVQAHWTGFTLPAGINPANVTAVYANVIASDQPLFNNFPIAPYSNTNLTCNGVQLLNAPGQYPQNGTQVSGLTGLTGATFNSTAACSIQVGGSGPGSSGELVNVSAVRFLVYSTDAPAPSDTRIHLQPPLGFNAETNTFYLDEANNPAGFMISRLIRELPPAAATNQAWVFSIFDGVDDNDCTVGLNRGGAGSHTNACRSDGSTYVRAFVGSGGTVGTYFTEVVSCTTTCTLAHTPTTFDNFSVNGLVMVDGTDFTRSGTTVTLTTPAVGGDVYYAQYHY